MTPEQLLARGDELGAAASKQTGVPYTPVGRSLGSNVSSPDAPSLSPYSPSPVPSPSNASADLRSLTDSLGVGQKGMFEGLLADLPTQEKTIMEQFRARQEAAKVGGEATRGLTNMQYGEKIEDQAGENAKKLTSEKEAQRGFAQNTAFLKDIEATGAKRIRDLERTRDMLNLQSKAAEASQIDGLIAEEQRSITEARKNWLDSFVNVSNLKLAQSQEARNIASFETPEQKREREFSVFKKEQDYLETLKPYTEFVTGQGGQTLLVDSRTGDVIKNLGSASKPSGGAGDGQLSTLSQAIMAGYGSLKDLTPTQKGEVLQELYLAGWNPKTTVITKIESLAPLWDKVPDKYKGPVQGRVYELGGLGGNIDPDVKEFLSAKNILTREVARLFDVGVLSDQDVASYKAAMPGLADKNREVIDAAISGLNTAATGQKYRPGQVVEVDGKKYTVDADGDTLIPQE